MLQSNKAGAQTYNLGTSPTTNGATISTCAGNFYDPGGTGGDYGLNQDYAVTFIANNGGQIRFAFSAFNLEANASCSYDYLRIYNGTSTSGTLIGTYCGTTSPGTVTSISGSLHFVFHSDSSVPAAGWAASISCVAGGGGGGCSGSSTLSQAGWTMKYTDSQETYAENGYAYNAFDGNPNTIWHSQYYPANIALPHEIQIDMGTSRTMNAFRYLPRQDGGVNGRIGNYEFYISADGTTWGSPVATGTWTYSNANEKVVSFAPTTGRYIRLRALSEANGYQWTSMAELKVDVCGNLENCSNGSDDDGDGLVDNADPDCNCTAPTFTFQSPTLLSGTAGAVGAVYRFSNVLPGTHANVTIVSKTHADIGIVSMDEPSTTNGGYDWAFQPIVDYDFWNSDGSYDAGGDRSVRFRFDFIDATTGSPKALPEIKMTAVDVDGDSYDLREFVQSSLFNAYELQSPTSLTLSGSLKALGALPAFNGVVETALQTMITFTFNNKSNLTIDYGCNFDGTASFAGAGADIRLNCLFFKCYNLPIQVNCPVVQASRPNPINCANLYLFNSSVSGSSGTCSIQWQRSTDNVTWTNIAGATSASYTSPAIATTTYFRVFYNCTGNSTCGNVYSNVLTVNVQPPCSENCSNSIDDDGDGLVDCADPSCANSFTVTTTSTVPSICLGGNSTISASASGGTGPYTYNWSHSLGNSISHNISPLVTTIYTVTVTSAPGCTSTAQVTITVNYCAENCTDGLDNDGDGLVDCADPDCGLTVSATPISPICGANNGQVTITASGGSGIYQYSNNNSSWQGANTFSSLALGNFTFYVRNASGSCATSITATVPTGCEICTNGVDDDGDGLADCYDADCRPTASAGANVSICVGTSTTLNAMAVGGATPYSFSWSNGLGAGATKNVSPVSTTTYTVTISSPSGCSSTAQVTITVTTCAESCSDGIDNDGDGLIDCTDPDCAAVGTPQLVNDVFTTCPGAGPYGNLVSINDGNLLNPTFTIVTPPAKGSVSINNFGAFSYTPADNQCGSVQFTYQVCNGSTGCCATANATINIGDNLPPTLQNVPGDITISCDDEVQQPPVVLATDFCPFISIEVSDTDDMGSMGACGTYTITRTWTTTDLCGNTASQSQHITVTDQTKPEMFRVYTLPNGKKMVAGVAQRTSQLWKYVKFPIHFDTPPLVFAQVNSSYDNSPVTVQTRYISNAGFELRLREEESADQLHGTEMVAWMAIEPGNVDGAVYKLAAQVLNSVNQNAVNLAYPLAFNSPPIFIATMNGTVQADPATIRTNSQTTNGLSVFMQEEQSSDTETTHSNEKLAWLALSNNSKIYDMEGGFVAEGGMVSANQSWVTVSLQHRFTKPVVLFGAIPFSDTQPTTIRVRNVTPTSFEVRVQEWAYLDGIHSYEALGYLVVEGSIPTDDDFFCFNQRQLQPGVDVIAIDNCDGQVAFGFDETESLLQNGLQTIRSWTAIDDCGNVNLQTRYDTCLVAAVRLRALLAGGLVNAGTANLMRDELREKGYLPIKEPYSSLAQYTVVGNSGRDETPALQLFTPKGEKSVVDWVFVEVRSEEDDKNVLATQSVLLLRDGTLLSATGSDTLYFWDIQQGDYFVTVRHRNHIGLMTDQVWHLCSQNPPLVNFTDSSVTVRGGINATKLMNGKRALWAADFNGDGKAIYQGPYNDVFFLFSKVLSNPSNVDNLANYILEGYVSEDANLDGKAIYQGPGNDRSMLLLNTILAHSGNQYLLANYIVMQMLP